MQIKEKIIVLPLHPCNHPLAVLSAALCNYVHLLVSNSTTVPATVFGNNSKSYLSIFRIHFGSFSIVNVLQLLHIRCFAFWCNTPLCYKLHFNFTWLFATLFVCCRFACKYRNSQFQFGVAS